MVKLVLVDNDEYFIKGFSRYILEYQSNIEIITYTDIEVFKASLASIAFDLVLISEIFPIDDSLKNLKNLFILSDETFEDDTCKKINKYQKTETLLKEIMLGYAELKGDRRLITNNETTVKLIGVYSPIGGSGKTTFSLALAGCLAKRNVGVLYLSLEKFFSAERYLGENLNPGLSELFLKLKNKSVSISFDINKKVQTDSSGVKYITPPESAMEYGEMTDEEMVKLINEISYSNVADYVIIDFPTEYNEGVINTLSSLDTIAFIVNEDSASMLKATKFAKEFDLIPSLNSLYDKVYLFANKTQGKSPTQVLQNLYKNKSILGCIPNMNLEGITDINSLSSVMDGYMAGFLQML
ncbi:MAG: AAA family ATPase [Firmicutes bacterium]|nr:AAA family ATPase [Bacillota bacterium]